MKQATATQSATTSASVPSLGRGYLWVGIGLTVIAIALFMVQFSLQRLFVPWYVPILTTLGVALVAWALMKRRSATRFVALGLLAALAVFEWQFLAVGARLPEYLGEAQSGRKFPPFYTSLADGRTFTVGDLEDGTPRVMTFFRGRW